MKPKLPFAYLAVVLLLAGCSSSGERWSDLARQAKNPVPTHGLVAFRRGWIGVVDSKAQTLSQPLLVGQLGTADMELLDPVLTRDGKTGLVSSFGGSTVYVLDLTHPEAPELAGAVTLSFYAEDIALTPDSRFALVTDGGSAPKIAVIDVAARTLVEEFDATPAPVAGRERVPDTERAARIRRPSGLADPYVPSHQSVVVASDGRTVMTVDYFGAKVNVLTLDASGHLTYGGALDMPSKDVGGTPTALIRPVNISVSPDGKTAIVAGLLTTSDPVTGDPVFADMVFPVFRITGPGQVEAAAGAHPTLNIKAAQSVAFSPDGKKAYLTCVPETPADPDALRLVVVELDVTGAGQVAHNGATLATDFVGTSQLFGVDTLAVDPAGRYLYVSNPTGSGALKEIQVFDLASRQRVKRIAFTGTVSVPGPNPGDPATDEEQIPMGITFARP